MVLRFLFACFSDPTRYEPCVKLEGVDSLIVEFLAKPVLVIVLLGHSPYKVRQVICAYGNKLEACVTGIVGKK